MREKLQEPSAYLERLSRLRASNPYAKRWVIRLERHTNRHPECSGAPWGWYEIFPFSLEVGFWGSDKDDLKGVDIGVWNREARELSTMPTEALLIETPNAGIEPKGGE